VSAAVASMQKSGRRDEAELRKIETEVDEWAMPKNQHIPLQRSQVRKNGSQADAITARAG